MHLYLATTQQEHSFFRASAEKIYVGLTGIVAAKGSRLLQLIDPSVARLQDSGLLRKWQGDYLFLDVMRKAYRQGIHLEQAVTRPLNVNEVVQVEMRIQGLMLVVLTKEQEANHPMHQRKKVRKETTKPMPDSSRNRSRTTNEIRK